MTCLVATALVVAMGTTAAQSAPRTTAPLNPSFETGDLTGWTATGDAFGPGAVTDATTYWDTKLPFHQKGAHHLWGFAAAGDDATGTLKSSSFSAGSRLSFLVGGGWDPDKLYVALVRDSDGAQLLKQTGPEDEAYVRILWDTSAWRGQGVHLEVVDRKTGGFGHLNVDDIRTGSAATRDDNGLTFRALGQANQPKKATYSADPLRPQFHYTPYQGWINDPNGLVQFKGRHQLFSQFNPDAPKWGPMHWAHADSADAVHWRNLPVALYPPKPATPTDNSGIFSGSSVVDTDGWLVVAYTRSTDTGAHPGATPETVETARSTDGVTFDTPREVIKTPPAGSSAGFRDPKVFRDPTDGRWKMIVGSGDGGHGKVFLYASDDLDSWTYEGVLASGGDGDGAMWECPNLFPLDAPSGSGEGRKWVLLTSVNEGGASVQHYAVGTYDGKTFTAQKKGVLDGAGDTYAAQTYRDDSGRELLVSWMSDWNDKEPTRVNGWAGAQSVTRELFLRADGGLGQRPVKEVASLAGGTVASAKNKTVTGSWRLGRADVARLKADIDVAGTTADTVTVRLKAAPDGSEATELRYSKSTGTLTLDTTGSGYGTAATHSAHVEPVDGHLSLEVLIDRSSVEVFTGDGESLTARVYPRYVESDGVEFAAAGGEVRLRSASLTRLGSSWGK
ncbi:glycoside hydrolase family 32 protein [Streptomyces fractus]|uniref:glycoside hydrolase family 32 protein n=1 Tax=Streptomyces fractus TaxID=641806 RepID=UPI003CF757C9